MTAAGLRRTALLLSALVAGCRGGEPPAAAPDCLAPFRATATPSLKPLVDALEAGQVVILGEHHGDPAELGLLTAVVEQARARGLALDVAMELLPVRGQAPLTALHSRWTPAGWWQLVAARYHPEPLQLQAYGDAVAAMIAAGARVHALAPDCGPADAQPATLDAAVQCFSDRDATMAAALAELRAPDRALLVSAGLWHGAHRRPGGQPSLAHLLEQNLQDDVLQAVVMGTEGPDPAGPAGPPGTCAGLGRALQTDHPWTARLDAPPWRALPGRCLAEGENAAAGLGELFDLVAVPAESGSAAPAMLPPVAWEAAGPERRAAWRLLEVELMGRPDPGLDPLQWAERLTEAGIGRAQRAALPGDACGVVRRLGLSANTGQD